MKYLVSHQGLASGPHSLEEIANKVRAKELDMFDYLFDEEQEDWVLLMEFPKLAARLKSSKPPRPPQLDGEGFVVSVKKEEVTPVTPVEEIAAKAAPTASVHAISEWYVLKGENRFGPFSYVDLVKMLQQKVVFPFDFIWHSGLETWKRVAELSDFEPSTIRALFTQPDKSKDVFVQRKFARKTFTGRVIVHDNLSLWTGDGFEISRGGVGINMGNSFVVPGQHVFVHFKRHEAWPAFNAVCEVVSKKFVNDQSPVQYGLRFLSLSQEVQDEFYKRVA